MQIRRHIIIYGVFGLVAYSLAKAFEWQFFMLLGCLLAAEYCL